MKTKFKGILMLFLLLAMQFSFAQEKVITGTVTDELGPVADISVTVKGTTKGTITDFDGKYSIKAKKGDILVFSHISYGTLEKIIGDSTVIDVKLTDSGEQLDEIVVTGVAGATNRKKLSVTVNKVSSKDLEFVPATSAENALQGKVAGVSITNFGQPGDGATIQLRGATNLFGTQSPLIIVDGVIVEGGLQDVNTDDIASFEIVKGASASALYGSRAGNGVVVITTKKGKSGKIDVTFKNQFGYSQINNFLDLNQSHHYQLASDWQQFEGQFTKFEGVNYPSDYNGWDYRNVTGGRLDELDHYSDNKYAVYHNAQEQFFKKGVNQSLYASIASGSEKTKLFFSAEKSNTQGILRETKGYERVSARLNADFQVNNWLKFTANNNYIRTNNNTPGGTGGIFFDLSVIEPEVNLENSNLDGQPYLLVPYQWNSTGTNPIYPLYSNPELKKQNKFLGSYGFNIRFSDKFNFDTQYAVESISNVTTDFISNKAWTTGGTQQELYAIRDLGSYSIFNYTNLSQKAQFTLNYKQIFNDLIVTSKASYLLEDSKYNDFYARATDQKFSGKTISLDNYENIFSGSDSDYQSAKNIFAIVGLDYKDRYIFDAMYRIDQSSLFGENHRTNDYYRVSGAYRISKDVDISGVQELKVHAAIGTSGQRPGYNWQYARIPVVEGTLGLNRIKPNPDLRPSTTTETEFGLSTQFLDRFNLDVVYSKAKTKDQFMLVNIFAPSNDGFNKQWQNIGTVDFNTLEIALDVDVLKEKKFKWNMGVVFDKTNNEITQLDVNPITVGPNNGEMFRIQEGVEFGTMYGRKFVTSLEQMANQLPSGMTIGDYTVNRDGVVVETANIGTVDEKAIILLNDDGSEFYGEIGTATPDFKLGVRNSFSYKGFNLYTLLDYKHGGDIYNRNGQWLTRDYRSKMVDQSGYADGEKKTIDYYQSLYDTNETNGFWVEDGTYLKLRELSLFYTFKENQLNGIAKGFFKSIRIGVTGTNLLTWTNYSGWDPEVQSYDDDTLQYYPVDYRVYPVSSSYTFSFMLKF
jgi:TonB-linked SusC/RagA family outer membrane protein